MLTEIESLWEWVEEEIVGFIFYYIKYVNANISLFNWWILINRIVKTASAIAFISFVSWDFPLYHLAIFENDTNLNDGYDLL
jgi:hypothetical protein